MYLLRGPQAQSLLQTISRVNRPYKSPNGRVYKYGYITDFVDIEEEYDRTVNDYLKELEKDINISDDDEYNSLNGLLVDVDTIKKNYENAENSLTDIIVADDIEKFSQRLMNFNKEALLQIKRLLNTMKDCFTEFMLSNAMEEADKVDIEDIKKKLRSTQERIDFINLTSEPVRMMDLISNEEVVKLVYDFIRMSTKIMDLSKFDKSSTSYQDFEETMSKVQNEIKKNRNKDDVRIITLNEVLKKLFNSMDIRDISDLNNLTDEMRKILEEAEAINKENDRLASIYGNNFALVKSYQDVIIKRPELSNKDVEQALLIIYGEIQNVIEIETLAVQGREGFIDETKKKVTKLLLKSGLYKSLGLKNWIDMLLSDLYTNLQNYK